MSRSALVLVVLAGCGNDIKLGEGANQEPVVDILSPEPESEFTDDQAIDFQGTVADGNGPGDLGSVVWASSLDGPLGNPDDTAPDANGITRLAANLTVGTHVVTLTATDLAGAIGEDAITVLVVVGEQSPDAQITSPTPPAVFTTNDTVALIGGVSDPQQEPATLAATWSIDLFDGTSLVLPSVPPTDAGVTSATWSNPPIGTHFAVLTVTDADGNTAWDDLEISVLDPGSVDSDADGYSPNSGDCDEGNPDVNPGEIDVCGNSIDDDCNDTIDDKDLDVDLHIDADCAATTTSTVLPADDCEDGDAAIYPGAPETLDGTDQDCDGFVDDGTAVFDDDGDCFCEEGPCIDGIEPSCASIEPGDCDDASAATNPAASDVPDAAFADEDCDGIDGHAATATFVAPGGIDQGSCPMNAPCATIEFASGAAQLNGFSDVYVSAGTYAGVIDLLDGIDVYGGYDAGWVRAGYDVAGHEVRLTGGSRLEGVEVGGQQYFVISAVDLLAGARLADLVIDAPDAVGHKLGNGKSSYGLHAVRSVLTLDRVHVEGGQGEAGEAGDPGASASAVAAPAGNSGGSSSSFGSACNIDRVGGGSGATNPTCGGRTEGGDGGSGGSMDTDCDSLFGVEYCSPCDARSGLAGGAAPTNGAGYGFGGSGGGTCGGAVGTGGNGIVTHGTGAAGGGGEGSLVIDWWFGAGGLAGTAGLDGTGGGGGGGSGGCDNGTDDSGAGGGGGGAGGCAGTGGTGGGAGGSSFALFAVDSALIVNDSSLVRGNGGSGGAGGAGGAGQPGGAAGAGGGATLDTASGGNGGSGGAGGAGGGGGGGAGGMSWCVYTLNSAVSALGTQFSGGTGGSGGAGGSSSGDPGDAGAAGPSGDIGTCATSGGC